MLITLMSNLGMFGAAASSSPDQTGGALPPWIPTPEQAKKHTWARQVIEEMQAKEAPDEIADQVQQVIVDFYEGQPPPALIDFQGLIDQAELMQRLLLLYAQFREQQILADDERVLQLLIESGMVI